MVGSAVFLEIPKLYHIPIPPLKKWSSPLRSFALVFNELTFYVRIGVCNNYVLKTHLLLIKTMASSKNTFGKHFQVCMYLGYLSFSLLIRTLLNVNFLQKWLLYMHKISQELGIQIEIMIKAQSPRMFTIDSI